MATIAKIVANANLVQEGLTAGRYARSMNPKKVNTLPVFPAGHFIGETATWDVADALLSEVRHSTARAVAPHAHEASYFTLLLEGKYSEHGDGFSIRYEPYTLAFHSARSPHTDEMEGPCRFFAVELLARWERVITELGGAQDHIFEMRGGDPVWLVLHLYREFLERETGPSSEVEALVYDLCAYVARPSAEEAQEPAWLNRVEEYLAKRFGEAFDLAQLSASVGVHPSHLCRSFRRFRQRTISSALWALRVQHVCRRLGEVDEALSDIAVDAGFADQSHMHRVFKRLTGYAPGEYRRIFT